MNDVANGWVWFGFAIFIIFALSVDTFFLDKKNIARPHASMRAALIWSLIWVVCALLFNLFLWLYLYLTSNRLIANDRALVFFTGYLIEKLLSLDNLFVFYIIFASLKTPPSAQQRVFSYGIWSAIIMRLLLILLGIWLVERFHWILYLMGVFLLITGFRMLVIEKKDKQLTNSWITVCLARLFRLSNEHHGNQFFVIKNGLRYATPLLVALCLIEGSDLIFAMDSIPAIFSITQDPFIIYSSNIFAILGLRAMYFLLSNLLQQFYLLKYGIALILIFVGGKMILAPWVSVTIGFSLGIIIGILLILTLASFILQRHQ